MGIYWSEYWEERNSTVPEDYRPFSRAAWNFVVGSIWVFLLFTLPDLIQTQKQNSWNDSSSWQHPPKTKQRTEFQTIYPQKFRFLKVWAISVVIPGWPRGTSLAGRVPGLVLCAGSWVWSQTPPTSWSPRVVGAGESQKQTQSSCSQMWGAFGVSEPPWAAQGVRGSPAAKPFQRGSLLLLLSHHSKFRVCSPRWTMPRLSSLYVASSSAPWIKIWWQGNVGMVSWGFFPGWIFT